MADTTEIFTDLTSMIVSAYVAHNNVTRSDLIDLITSTHAALAKLNREVEPPPPAALVPAISIKKSVTPDAIICLEDGKAFKSLRRHLGTAYNLTPEQYRAKWGLPADYPMVAPNYSEARAALAKASGLGRKAKPVPPPPPVLEAPVRSKRATRKKVAG